MTNKPEDLFIVSLKDISVDFRQKDVVEILSFAAKPRISFVRETSGAR